VFTSLYSKVIVKLLVAGTGGELASALSFLMQLGFRQVGRPYHLDALTPLEQQIACHMAQLGLLYTFVAVRGGLQRVWCGNCRPSEVLLIAAPTPGSALSTLLAVQRCLDHLKCSAGHVRQGTTFLDCCCQVVHSWHCRSGG
jgi:hypothetical protein